MTIRNTIDHLPRATNAGAPPTKNPFMIEAISSAWEQWYEDQGYKDKDHAIPEAGPYRGSYASKRCDRQLYYALAGTEPSDPPTTASYWTFYLGQMVHEALQPAIMKTYPGAAEMIHDLRQVGIPGSSHSDLCIVLGDDDERTLTEIKSMNGYAFKRRATVFQGPQEGPMYGAVLQAVMNAAAEGINRVVVLIVSLECVSPNLAEWLAEDNDAGRFMAEWHYTVEEMRPQLEAEARRINEILNQVVQNDRERTADEPIAQQVLPPRRLRDPEYPDGAVVVSPLVGKAPWTVTDDEGNVVDTGTYWGCGYCDYFKTCKEDGA